MLIRTGGVSWIVSIVVPAIDQLALIIGCSVHMIIKARSCQVRQTLRHRGRFTKRLTSSPFWFLTLACRLLR